MNRIKAKYYAVSGFLLILVVSSFSIYLFGYDEVIKKGNFDGLHIGLSTKEVFLELKKSGIEEILPDVSDSTHITAKNIQDLSKLSEATGICLSNSKEIALNLKFNDNNELVSHFASVNIGDQLTNITKLTNKNEILLQLKKILENDKSIVAWNCLPGSKWVHLNKATETDLEYLEKNSTWTYHLPHSYSRMTLFFSNSKLKKAIYHHRFVEE